MTARAHAALWLVAITMSWVFAGALAVVEPETARAAGSEVVRDMFRMLTDPQMARVRNNLLRTGFELRGWLELAPVWAPLILAGAVDGAASRRARRCGLEPAPELGLHLGQHALVALTFAPVLWASTGANAAPAWIGAWAIAMSASLSSTLSRVQGLGLRG
jgi:hypothetical protein